MKYQNRFSGKNKKNIINLSSAELVQRVVKVNLWNFSENSQCRNNVFVDRQISVGFRSSDLHFYM